MSLFSWLIIQFYILPNLNKAIAMTAYYRRVVEVYALETRENLSNREYGTFKHAEWLVPYWEERVTSFSRKLEKAQGGQK